MELNNDQLKEAISHKDDILEIVKLCNSHLWLANRLIGLEEVIFKVILKYQSARRMGKNTLYAKDLAVIVRQLLGVKEV